MRNIAMDKLLIDSVDKFSIELELKLIVKKYGIFYSHLQHESTFSNYTGIKKNHSKNLQLLSSLMIQYILILLLYSFFWEYVDKSQLKVYQNLKLTGAHYWQLGFEAMTHMTLLPMSSVSTFTFFFVSFSLHFFSPPFFPPPFFPSYPVHVLTPSAKYIWYGRAWLFPDRVSIGHIIPPIQIIEWTKSWSAEWNLEKGPNIGHEKLILVVNDQWDGGDVVAFLWPNPMGFQVSCVYQVADLNEKKSLAWLAC